jgi:lipoprotein-anchoring transpeptidase ErfK/SrfK
MDHRNVAAGLCYVLLVGLAAEVGWFAGRARTHHRAVAAAPAMAQAAPLALTPVPVPAPPPSQPQTAAVDKAAIEPTRRRSGVIPPARSDRPLARQPAIATQVAEGQAVTEPVVAPAVAAPSQPAPAPAPVATATSARVLIVVSLASQRAFVFKNGELWDSARVSTGKPGKRTPAGRFTILQKQVHHRSTKYDDAPMPYMERITWGGVALHAGHVPGYPASHGCIRLPAGFAKRLYRITDFTSTVVVVTKKRARSAEEARAVS